MWVPSVGQKIPWRRACHLLQYSCLENPIDRGARHATVPRVTNSQTRLKQLSMHTCKSWAWRLKSIFHSANFVWSQLQQQREICPKSFRQVFSSMWSKNFERYMLGLAEAAKPEIKLLTFVISQRNQGNSKKKKKSTSSLSTLKSLTVWITTNCGKFLKR